MLSFLIKYRKVILIAVSVLALTAFLYFEGKSSGKAEGFSTGYKEAESKYAPLVEKAITEKNKLQQEYNEYIEANNKLVSDLEKKSVELSNSRREWMNKYEALSSKSKMSESNANIQAWTLETVQLLNNIIYDQSKETK